MQTDATVLLVGENRRAAKGFTQALTISHHQLVAATGQHTLVVGELAVDQLGGEGKFTSGGANVVLTEHDADVAILLSEQTCQLQDTFARHDHLMLAILLDGRLHGTHGQAVAIGGHGAQQAALYFQQHAVEVVAHILLGHGEAGALDQATYLALHQVEGQRAGTFFDRGDIVGRQGGKGKAATPGLDQQLLLVDADIDQGITGQALADVHQLARRYGDLAWLGRLLQGDTAHQLDLKVGTGQGQLLAFDHQQHIGEHWQGLASFHDTSDQLQGFQQGFALNGEMHGLVPCLVESRIK